MEHTCKHTDCTFRDSEGKQYSCKTSNGLTRHHRTRRYHPCCQNGNMCATGTKVRSWNESKVDNSLKCGHNECDKLFKSKSSRSNHQNSRHHCRGICKYCQRGVRQVTQRSPLEQYRTETERMVRAVDYSKITRDVPESSLLLHKAVVLAHDRVTGQQLCVPYPMMIRSTINAISQSQPCCSSLQREFLTDMSESATRDAVIARLHTVKSNDEALDLLKHSRDSA